ncbi:MAG: hypothetical protein ABSA42_02895 [Terracidiphilus sp.]
MIYSWTVLIQVAGLLPLRAEGQDLTSGNYRLSFPKLHDGRFALRIVPLAGSAAAVSVDRPAEILIKRAEADQNAEEPVYSEPYAQVTRERDGSVLAQTDVVTGSGSRFRVADVYRASSTRGSFVLTRTVRVSEANAADQGFNSRFAIGFSNPGPLDQYYFFAPGIWYDKNSHVVPGAIASDYNDNYFYYRETRSGLPMIMMQDDATGTALSIAHLHPNSSSGADETSADWLVDPSVQYASLGAHKVPQVAIALVYPACEGEKTYIRSPNKWVRRSHPVQKGFSHSYTIEITLNQFRTSSTKKADFRAAYTQTWRHYYRLFNPPIQKVPIQTVYQDGISLLNIYSAPRNGAWGWPFLVLIPDGTVPPDKISYQMGFVGDQIPAAFQMIRFGYLNHNEEILKKGIATMDFWADRASTKSGLPLTWYNVTPATFRDDDCHHPSFLRIMSDGMEGALDAAMFMREHGEPHPNWERFVIAYGNWLVRHQNSDGSVNRAFNPDGTIFRQRQGCSRTGFGESKFNTTHPVRFLVGLYFATGDTRFLNSAKAAGEFAYTNIFAPGLYVGGTADNPDTLDKEAGVQALHAFLALYDATGSSRWLDAAADAAAFTETWMYAWNFAIRDASPQYAYAGMQGQSLIATGHSATDVYLGFAAYDFYRLHLLRVDPDSHFLQIARYFASNTKLSTQLTAVPTQNFGFAHSGLVGEAVNLSNLQYLNSPGGAHSWLPWLTIAEIESLQKLQDTFGSMSIEEIESLPLNTRRAKAHHIYTAPGSLGFGKE